MSDDRCPRCGEKAHLTAGGVWCNVCGLQLPELARSQTTGGTVPPNAEQDVIRAAQALKVVHDSGPVPEPFAEKSALRDLFDALSRLPGRLG